MQSSYTNPRRFLWSTMSRLGKASHNCSIVVTLVKPKFLAISAIGPWPLIKQCFLWNSVYIFNGLCDMMTCSGDTYTMEHNTTFCKVLLIYIQEFREFVTVWLLWMNVVHCQHWWQIPLVHENVQMLSLVYEMHLVYKVIVFFLVLKLHQYQTVNQIEAK